MEFAIFVHRKRLEMKKFYYLLLVVVALSSGLQSCDNGKTYAEMKEDEADAINSYINQNDIKVISEAEFAAQDSTNLADNEYVLLEESGVYMHVSYRGNGKEVLSDGSYDMIARFVEVALQTRSEMFEAGDTLMANMHILNPDYYIEGEDFKLTISDGSYSASFTRSDNYSMYGRYGTVAVPSGWLIPLRYLKPSRTSRSDQQARVKLIVPHSEGTSTAQQYVYPCCYEIAYNLY